MNKAVQGAARLIFFAALLLFTGCKDLFHDKEPETPKEYTVTFDAAGGSPETQTRTVREGASLGSSNMPAEPGRAGYIFDGWYTEAEGEGSEFNAGTPVSEDITVYAWWKYTVTFDAAGGSPATQTRTVTNGASLDSSNMPSAPTKSGYIFNDWYTEAEGGGSAFIAGTPVTGNITVYAWWTLDTPIQYTVTFDAAGGSPATNTRAVSDGSSVGSSNMPSAPSRSGYIFNGWYTEADGGGREFSAGTVVSGDMTVYARWSFDTSIQYTVTFDTAEGSPATRTVTNGSSLGSSNMPPAPIRNGYIFKGWYTGAEGEGSEFSASTIVSGNLTVYAWWKIQYVVTFDAAGGSPATQTRTVTDGDSVGSSGMPSAPGRAGYIFNNWYTATNGGGSEFSAATIVTGDIRVYARWILDTSIQCTVTFDAAGGSPATQTRTVPNGGSLGSFGMPPAPGRTGYIFSGWYTGDDGGGSEFTAGTTVTGDIRVYAGWIFDTSIQYTVTFDATEGSPASQTRTVTNGSSLGSSNMPPAPGREGYIFSGWYTGADGGGSEFAAGTIVIGDITVYAWWTLDTSIQYTVSFDTTGGSPTSQTRTVTNGGSIGSSNMPSAPGRAGYIFNGWYTTTNGGGSEFTAGTIVSGDITVYAWWKTQYTVTFDATGGSPAMQTWTVTDGDFVGSSNMPSAPCKEGYIFNNWYTATNGGGSEFTAGTIVSGDITVYARWILDTSIHTVTFDATGGSPATQTRTVTNGSSLGSSNMPSVPGRMGYSFSGWYTAANGGGSVFTDGTIVSGDITVYAWWMIPVADNLSLDDALTWIDNNAVTGNTYVITLNNNETIAPRSLVYSGKTVGITLSGGTMERTVGLSTSGALFALGNGVTLTLDDNVTLQGRSNNTASLVQVNSGGTLVMNTGSKLNGNTNSSSSGGGVYVGNSGTFTMNGGIISDNNSSDYGGGVLVYGGTFTMSGGTISGNTFPWRGGGVYVTGGTFAMSGGTINDNGAFYGGGVYVGTSGTFTMSGGSISGNTSIDHGGGVYVGNSGTFNMNGGIINGNIASSSDASGGGVYVGNSGTFTMIDGTISGNTASRGGGVYVFNTDTGTFTKQPGGVIYGANESNSALRNTATSGNNNGHTAYVYSPTKKRDATAGIGTTMNSGLSGSTGGWE